VPCQCCLLGFLGKLAGAPTAKKKKNVMSVFGIAVAVLIMV